MATSDPAGKCGGTFTARRLQRLKLPTIVEAIDNEQNANSGNDLDKMNRRELTLLLQEELKRVGCDPGPIDGAWGAKGRNALSEFMRIEVLYLPVDRPTPEIIREVQKIKSPVCKSEEAGSGKPPSG